MLERRAFVKELLAERGDLLVVCGLGSPTYDVAAAGDHPLNLYLWGAMGGAVMIGLGLALAQPDLPVVVVTGDGEMLMGMGSLATVGLQKPKNLSILVLDNEAYGETGGQVSHTSAVADLVGVARACGIPDSKAISTLGEIESFAEAMQVLSDATVAIDILVTDGRKPDGSGLDLLQSSLGRACRPQSLIMMTGHFEES